MKKTILFGSLFLLTLISCNSEEEKLKNEYAKLLVKEYAEVKDSEAFANFQKRYAFLSELTKQVHESEQIELTEAAVDTLCFIPPNEFDLQIEQLLEEKRKDKKELKPYARYINQSNEVNAVLLGAGFYLDDIQYPAFHEEGTYHRLHNLTQPDDFFGTQKDSSILYERFCEDRIVMDRFNNSRYVLILKDLVNIDSEYNEEDDNDEFTSGVYSGTVYVYDLQTNRFVDEFQIGGANSEVVESKRKNIESSLNANLNQNIEKAIQYSIETNYGLRGELPYFFKP